MTTRVSDSSRSQLGRIARGGAINLVGAVVSSIGGFVLVVLVTNGFTEQQAGELFAAVSAFLIASAIVSLGADTGLARFLPHLEAERDHRRMRDTVFTAFRPIAVSSLVFSLATVVAAGALAEPLGLTGPDGASILQVFAISLPFAALAEFWLGCTRAFGRMRPSVVVDNITRTLLQVAAVLVVAAIPTGGTGLAIAWSLPYVLAGIVATLLAVRLLDRRSKGWQEDPPTDIPALRREYWAYTWPRAIARVGQIALQRIDIVLIAIILGARDAALYTAATRFVVLGQFATQAIQRVLLPRFSALVRKNDTETITDVFKVSTAWSMALSWPLYLMAACAAPLYLQLFGSGYADGSTSVVVTMALAMMVAIAAGPLDTLLLMAGKSTASLIIMLVSLVIDVVLCLVLLPTWGIFGAALAWALAVVVRNALTFWQVHSMMAVTPLSRAAAIVSVASVVCFAVPLLAVGAAGEIHLLGFVLATVVGSGLYGLALWVARDALELSALRALLPARWAGGRG